MQRVTAGGARESRLARLSSLWPPRGFGWNEAAIFHGSVPESVQIVFTQTSQFLFHYFGKFIQDIGLYQE